MTKFNKELFTWDGMYLMYSGEYAGQPTMDEVHPNCHPDYVGVGKPAFIARFKYGRKPYKSWINFLVKNFTVEEYLNLAEATSPLEAVRVKGYSK
jgi:hypothetical protein